MDGAGSSSSGHASSTSATEHGPRAHRQPPTGIYVVVVTRNLAPIAPSRVRVAQPGRTDTGPAVIVVQSGDGDGDGGDYDAFHGDADTDAGAQDDDARGGIGFGAVPASGVAMACLPETTVAGEQARGRGECAVCLEEYEAGDAVRTMPCAHGFHERCIFGWLRLSRLCPLCRFALPPEAE